MLNQSLVVILTILFACHGVGSAHEGGSGRVGDSEVRLFSNSPRLNGNVQEVRTSDPSTNKSQKPSGLELNAALEYSNLPRDFYDPTFHNEPFKELLAANQTMRTLSNFSGGSANETDSSINCRWQKPKTTTATCYHPTWTRPA
jgi:hypothetical protein